MLAWWIAGIAYRFSQRGKYACGDFVPEGMSQEDWVAELKEEDSLYQRSSGNFMFYYYIICAVMYFLTCLFSCCICCASLLKITKALGSAG